MSNMKSVQKFIEFMGQIAKVLPNYLLGRTRSKDRVKHCPGCLTKYSFQKEK